MKPDTVQLSVVIPTLDEAASLPGLLAQLQRQQHIRLEVIVVDGGSRDATPRLATAGKARLVCSPPGRGRQMNLGAARARAPLLLFLHADSALSSSGQLAEAVAALRQASTRLAHHRLAGHFRLRFQRTRPGRDLAYRYYEEKSALNRAECTNGDQGMLLGRAFFQELGGFDETQGFLEDQRLAERIRRLGHWITLPGELVTSARRFETEGLARRMLLSAMIMNFNAIGLHAFFQRAATVYRHQAQTSRLQLSPIFELIDDLNREAGRHISRRRWLATGRYATRHLWQPFFFLDVMLQAKLGLDRRCFLALHDRLLAPLAGLTPMQYLTAGGVWLGYRLLRLWFRYRER